MKDKILLILLLLLVAEVALALLLPLTGLIPAWDTNAQIRQARLLPPFTKGFVYEEGSLLYFTQSLPGASGEVLKARTYRSVIFPLGTDTLGRDYLNRLLYGLRISLWVGLMGMGISLLGGLVLGAVAGFFGGKTDALLVWLVQILWTFPSVFVALTLSLILGKGLWTIAIAIGVSLWTETARIVRGETLRWKTRLFMEAARSLGLHAWHRLTVHLLPNILPVVFIASVQHFSTAVLLESGLSFLGLGIEPPTPSLGNLIAENKIFLFAGQRWLITWPAGLLVFNTLLVLLLANRLRDRLDVHGQIREE